MIETEIGQPGLLKKNYLLMPRSLVLTKLTR